MMLRYLLALLISTSAVAQEAAPVRNIAGDFAATWDATQNLPMQQRVAAFRKNVASKYPDFYSAQRFNVSEQVYDEHIAKFIERFGPMREDYLETARTFGDAMPRHVATFSAAFPDFRLTTPTWLVHSFGEMDGGTRTFNGRTDLIFGADMMVKLHGKDDLAPLFHHELFHVYHEPRFACGTGAVWTSLWEEGLATYVSHALNPNANLSELLLDFPKGLVAATEARLAESWAQLEPVLETTDAAQYGQLFSTKQEASSLPARRGYYLGYLVAKDAAKTRDLKTLAALDCKEVHALVASTVRKLSTEGKP
jgi:hypothetical protein